MATNPVRVIIELDVAEECISYRDGVRRLSDACKDELVTRISGYATMIYVSEV